MYLNGRLITVSPPEIDTFACEVNHQQLTVNTTGGFGCNGPHCNNTE